MLKQYLFFLFLRKKKTKKKQMASAATSSTQKVETEVEEVYKFPDHEEPYKFRDYVVVSINEFVGVVIYCLILAVTPGDVLTGYVKKYIGVGLFVGGLTQKFSESGFAHLNPMVSIALFNHPDIRSKYILQEFNMLLARLLFQMCGYVAGACLLANVFPNDAVALTCVVDPFGYMNINVTTAFVSEFIGSFFIIAASTFMVTSKHDQMPFSSFIVGLIHTAAGIIFYTSSSSCFNFYRALFSTAFIGNNMLNHVPNSLWVHYAAPVVACLIYCLYFNFIGYIRRNLASASIQQQHNKLD
jgi:hypothetical protein